MRSYFDDLKKPRLRTVLAGSLLLLHFFAVPALSAPVPRTGKAQAQSQDKPNEPLQKATILFLKKEFPAAITALGEILASTPDDQEALYLRTRVCFETGDFSLIIRDCTRLIELGDQSPQTLTARGRARFSTKEFDAARKDFEQALQANPEYVPAWYGSGMASNELKAYSKAIEALTEAIRLHEFFAEAYLARARAYRSLGKTAPALRDERFAAKIRPSASVLKKKMESLLSSLPSPDEDDSEEVETIRPKIRAMPRPKYTEDARKRGISGKVVLAVEVLSDGTVGKITVLVRLGLGLDESAIETIRQGEFSPATRNGIPVRSIYRMEIKFDLF